MLSAYSFATPKIEKHAELLAYPGPNSLALKAELFLPIFK
jgi:hypothetical protein